MRLYDVIDLAERKKKICIKTFKLNATTMRIFLFFFFIMQANENFKQKEKLQELNIFYFYEKNSEKNK